jgi:mono/diheme cytochrome c family protein
MRPLKCCTVAAFAIFAITACIGSESRYAITGNNSYQASLFRQHCVVCHGSEGDGKVLANNTMVPSLREGEFKTRSEAAIYNQIANGGNGMLPFRDILTQRELQMITDLVYRDLRGN